jgi:hypothetical protein
MSEVSDEPITAPATLPVEDAFRDPVEILSGAINYLVATRGEARAKHSTAFELLDAWREELVNGCIQDLLGESAKQKGIRCECRRHPWYRPVTPGVRELEFNASATQPAIRHSEPSAREPQRPPKSRNGKAAAAGEREEE